MHIALAEREVVAEGHKASKGFTLKANAHMMQILSGLYSDIPWAIVREYATNMLDGYIKLRRENPDAEIRPPEIHLPTTMAPYVEFKDFGAGMDFDTVWSVFTEYGASTKRDNNEEVGGLGLGSKTAFCYPPADPWIVESRFNHKRMVFHASKDNGHVPTLHHVESFDSVEPNGVTVRIPVSPTDFVGFKNAARRLLAFYPMDVKVTGDINFTFEKPTYLMEGDGWGLRKGSDSHVIMGNVPYPVMSGNLVDSAGLPSDLFNRYALDLRVPIGAVSFVPSREALMFNEHTVTTLKQCAAKFLTEFQAIVTERVKGAQTKWDALLALAEVEGISALRSHVTGIKWRGQTLDIYEGIEFQITPVAVPGQTGYFGPRKIEKGVIDLSKKLPGIRAEMFDNESQNNKIRRHEILSGEFLPLQKYQYVLLNDLPERGLAERVRQWLFRELRLSKISRYTGEKGDAVVFFGVGITAEQLSTALDGIPVVMTSTLPEPLVDGKPRGQRRKVMVKRWHVADWTPIEIDEEDETEVYFVKLEGANELVDFPGNSRDISRMWEAARKAGLVDTHATLYGIPRTLKRLEKRANWIEFLPSVLPRAKAYVLVRAQEMADVEAWDDYRFDSFMKLVQALDRTKLRDSTLLAQLKDAADAANLLYKSTQTVRDIETAFNMEAPPRKPTSKPSALVSKCQKKYPMVALLANEISHLNRDAEEVVTQYINSIK